MLNFEGESHRKALSVTESVSTGYQNNSDSFCGTQEGAFYHKMSVDHNASASTVSAQNFTYQP